MNLTENLKDILRAFNAHSVQYLIVGAHALGVHAEPRATKDLDLFIRSDAQNADAVFKALAEFGAPLTGLTSADFADGTTFQIGQPPERIDILQAIDGVAFDEAWSNRVEGEIDQIPACIISREDMIRNKIASGRLQDLADVEILRAAERATRK
ncbi:MAG: hypothetical protein P4L03_10515 [Terracidiphilus sp.]|nr:hypothetical protein [Terracidiphilus sp.]